MSSDPAARSDSRPLSQSPGGVPGWGCRLAWLPIPILGLVIAGLWIADLRTAYESRAAMVLLNVVFTWLASLCVCFLTARAFLGNGQPGLLMFGCGSLLWGLTSLVAAMVVDQVNVTVTIHNLGVFGAAVCHLAGLLWRGRIRNPARWLPAGYAAALAAAALIVGAALGGWTPLFFVQGLGGTPVREVVLLLGTGIFGWVGWQMVYRSQRQSGSFYYWYGLGLGLVATGLTGVMLLSVQAGILGWTNRLTQYLGSAYLLVAALAAARETGSWDFSLASMAEVWRENTFRGGSWRQRLLGWLLRYGFAVLVVGLAMGLRLVLTDWTGPGLPPYIMFYPAVMVVALLGGFGPGLLATGLSGLLADYYLLGPAGQLHIGSPVERLGLVVFSGMGLLVSAVAEFYRQYRQKAAAYDAETASRESRARLASFAEMAFEGIVESEAGRIVDCNEQFARMVGYTVAELKGLEIAVLVAPEDRERVLATIRAGRQSEVEHTLLCKDGRRIIAEVHGRTITGGARRHTALRDITERKRADEALRAGENLKQAILDSLPAHLALLDGKGIVTAVNEAWRRFARENGQPDSEEVSVGADYLAVCRKAAGDPLARQALEGIEAVLAGSRSEFTLEYPCDSPTQQRWFLMSVVRPVGDLGGAVMTHLDITKRRRAEQALETTLQRFYHVLSSMYSGILLMNDEGRLEFANQAFCDAFRLKEAPAELVGMASADLLEKILPAFGEPPAAATRIREILREGRPVRMEEFTMQGGGTALRDYVPLSIDGKSCGRLWIYTDITERKQAEQALLQSEQRYRTLFSTIDAGFCVIEMLFDEAGKPVDYRFLEVNRAFTQQTGLANAQGKRIRELAPEHEAHWFEIYGKIALTGESRHFVNVARQLNRWFDVYAYRLGAPEQRQVAILFTDITAQKRADLTLRKTQAELTEAQHIARFGSWRWDVKTDRTAGSEELLRIFGLDPAAQLMPDFQQQRGRCYPEAEWERIHAAMRQTLETGAGFELDAQALRGGASIWVTVRGEVLRDDESRLTGLQGTVQDISERKRGEQEILRRVEELRAANDELTRFNRVAMDRELRVLELKGQINRLHARLGQPAQYATAVAEEAPPTP